MTTKKTTKTKKPECIIRTYSAGVHMGHVLSHSGREVVLAPGAVRVWRWSGANTIHELAIHGCTPATTHGSSSRVSEPSPGKITLTEAIEIVEVSAAAAASIRSAGWAR